MKLADFHGDLTENGLKIIILPDPSASLVEVDVRYEVGSVEDPIGKGGTAHMIEHMMFQQHPIPDDPRPVFTLLQDMAIYFNAYTAWDATHYQNLVRPEQLADILALEAARMDLGCKTIPNEQFEREREVVRNERRQRYGTPEGQAFFKILSSIYPPGHPYGRLGIGGDEELLTVTLPDVCKFMNDYYLPERATVIIAGKVDLDTAKKLVAQRFGGINVEIGADGKVVRDADGKAKRLRKPASRREIPAIALKRHRIDYELDVEQPMVIVSWAMPPQYSKDGDAARVAASPLIGKVARLADQYEWADDVGAQAFGGPRAPALSVIATLPDNGKVDTAIDTILDVASRSYQDIDKGTNFDDFVAARRAGLVLNFEDLPARTNLFGDLAQFWPDGGYFGGLLKHQGEISVSQVRSLARSMLDPSKAVVVVIKTKKGAENGMQLGKTTFNMQSNDTRDSGLVDGAEAAQKLEVPRRVGTDAPVERVTLGNGMQVIFQQTGEDLPIMTIGLRFRAGYALESPANAGLADIACEMLRPPFADAGVGGEIADADVLGKVGAESHCEVSADATTFVVRGVNIYDEVLVKGLERWLKAGTYSQEGIEHVRKQLARRLKLPSEAASDHFDREFAKAEFGEGHPYASTGDPTVASLGHFGRDAAMSFHDSHYTAKNAILVVSGNFDRAHVEKVIRENFGSWSGGSMDKPVPATPIVHTGQIGLGVANPQSQSILARISFPAPAGMDGQYGARLILNEMINLKMRDVREKLGASYGVGSRLAANVGPGSYEMGGELDAQRAGEALKAMQEGITSLQSGNDLDAVFATARRHVLKSLVSATGTSGDGVRRLLRAATFGLADGYFDKLTRLVAAASLDQVSELAQAELKPELEVVGLMGPKDLVEKAFATANVKITKWVE
jgi:zinc protease